MSKHYATEFNTATAFDINESFYFNINIPVVVGAPEFDSHDIEIKICCTPVFTFAEDDENEEGDPTGAEVVIELDSDTIHGLFNEYALFLVRSNKSPLLTEKAADNFYQGEIINGRPRVKLDENGKLIPFKVKDLPWHEIFHPSFIKLIEKQNATVYYC